MRPNLFYTVIVLGVVLCARAELWPPVDSKPSDQTDRNQGSKIISLTFEEFKLKYSKKYSSLAEESYRRMIFLQNVEACNAHNRNPDRKYDMGPNFFMDMTSDQFQHVYTTVYESDQESKAISRELTGDQRCWKKECQAEGGQDAALGRSLGGAPDNSVDKSASKDPGKSLGSTLGPIENGGSPRRLETLTSPTLSPSQQPNNESPNQSSRPVSQQKTLEDSKLEGILIDWQPYSGPIRFQGYCGACYAFATVDTVSAHLAIYSHGLFYQLSVQQIVDCADNGLTFGCYGGYLQGALTYIKTKGVVSQTHYPYESGSKGFSRKCQAKEGGFKIASFMPLEEASCSSIIKELYEGPISAGISGYKLRFYSSGVFDDCSVRDRLDHAVVIIGYHSGMGWRIKNSWGVGWGEEGYGWIAEGNTCGICNMTVVVTV